MTQKLFNIKEIINKTIIAFLFLILSYLLLFNIRHQNTTLISYYLTDHTIQIINIIIMLISGLLSLIYFIYNKEKFNWIITIVMGAICIIYGIYFGIQHLNGTPLSEALSNFKQVALIIITLYFFYMVLRHIINYNHLRILNILMMVLILAIYLDAFINDWDNVINTYKNYELYNYSSSTFILSKNFIGILAFLSIVLNLYFYVMFKKRYYIINIIFLFIFNILSVCKTSVLCGLFVVLLFILHPRGQDKKKYLKKLLIVGGTILSLVIITLTTFSFLDSERLSTFISTFLYKANGTFMARFTLMGKAMQYFTFSNIFLGIGNTTILNMLDQAVNYNYYFHTNYVYHLATGGIVITLLLLGAFYVLIDVINSNKKSHPFMRYLQLIVFISYCAYSCMENVPLFSFTFNSYIFSLVIFIFPFSFNKTRYSLKEGEKSIAFITTIYPSKKKSWYGIYLKQMADTLLSQGHKVTILYISENKEEKAREENGVIIKPIYYRHYKLSKFLIPLGAKFKNNFKFAIYQDHYDTAIIHFYPVEMQNFIIDSLKNAGIKVLHYMHSRNIFQRVDEKRPLLRKLYFNKFYKEAYAKCDEIICVSNVARNDFLKGKVRVNSHVVYNGYNKVFYPEDEKLKEFNKNSIHLVSVGNLISIKGHRYALFALKGLKENHRNIKFYYDIIGSGKDEEYLKDLTKSLGLSKVVKFHKEKAQEDLSKFLENCDIFILPSYYESLGCCYLEAMAKGLVVIGCKHQGISEVIDQTCGYLVEENNVESIISAIEDIINNDRSMMRKEAQKRMKNFTWDEAMRELSKYL